jgi:hypothetical protein
MTVADSGAVKLDVLFQFIHNFEKHTTIQHLDMVLCLFSSGFNFKLHTKYEQIHYPARSMVISSSS